MNYSFSSEKILFLVLYAIENEWTLNTTFKEFLLKAVSKDKHIISELNAFFHNNDCNKAISYIMTIIRHLNLRSSYIGIEKCHNSKLTYRLAMKSASLR